MENRFEDALKREHSQAADGERMDKALSESEGDMVTGTTSAEEVVAANYSPGTTL